jgi:hypothetical protein
MMMHGQIYLINEFPNVSQHECLLNYLGANIRITVVMRGSPNLDFFCCMSIRFEIRV